MQADELLRLLGKVTANGQALEYVSCQVLGRLMGFAKEDDPTAIRLGQRLPMGARLDLIGELADLERASLDSGKVRAWLRTARKASDRRNSIIHSAWLGDPAKNEFRGALTKKGQHEPLWGEAELQDAIDQLRRAIEMSIVLLAS